MFRFTLFILLLKSTLSFSQGGWSWTELTPLPFKISNSAVESAIVDDTTYVYSFFGIDTTKIWSGINSKSFKYNTITQVWDTLPDLPDSLGGLIAAGATTINNKIYIIGGYHVFSNSNEVSSYETIIFDPVTQTYSRGANIPVEIDDHIQISYKDSLIYVISGWTSSIGGGNNTNKVQVYDVVNDSWSFANDMPNTSTFKVFGASGSIVNDTIIFAGGARYATNFPLVSVLRKGAINPLDPLDITWVTDTVANNFKPYRAASVSYKEKVFWIGGSSVSYNYDGIAYNGTGGVTPNDFITEYNSKTNRWIQYDSTPFDVMDLRGIAKISGGRYVICGGMNDNQEVFDKVYQLSYDTNYTSVTDTPIVEDIDTMSLSQSVDDFEFKILNNTFTVLNEDVGLVSLIDMFGRTIINTAEPSFSVLGVKGLFIVQVTFRNGNFYRRKLFLE